MSNPFVIPGEDGKPIFIGKEDPHNVEIKKGASSQIECPNCHQMVDYLIGDTKKGCESCYDKTKDQPDQRGETYDKSREWEV